MDKICCHINRAAVCAAAVLAAAAVLPAAAAGHARVVSAEQVRAAHGPGVVFVRFDEPVSTRAARVTIRDARGQAIVVRPAQSGVAWSRVLRVALPRLHPGRWTVALAALSEDGHLTDVVVRIAVPRAATAPVLDATVRAAPASPELALARAVTRGARDGALALGAGLAFALFVVWLPALRLAAGAGDGWAAAAADGLRRWVVLVRLATGVAAVTAPLTVALDAAGAELPTELWSTRAGLAALGMTAAAIALRAAATSLASGRRAPLLRPAVVGSTGLALSDPPARRRAAVLASAGALVVLAPLGGHAAGHGTAAVLAPAAVGHVAAVSLWLGALAVLLVAAAAGAGLAHEQRHALVAATGTHVARIAPLAVTAVVATGLVQAALQLHGPGDLVAIAWGRLLLAKTFLLALMLAWAARNRRALAHDDASLARGVGRELALAAVALVVAGALAGSAPPG